MAGAAAGGEAAAEAAVREAMLTLCARYLLLGKKRQQVCPSKSDSALVVGGLPAPSSEAKAKATHQPNTDAS